VVIFPLDFHFIVIYEPIWAKYVAFYIFLWCEENFTLDVRASVA